MKKKSLKAAFVLTLLYLAGRGAWAVYNDETTVYELTVREPVSAGGMSAIMPTDKVIIRKPRPQVDGSLCFTPVKEITKPGCIKVSSYYLREQTGN